jgi:hypothetical protein
VDQVEVADQVGRRGMLLLDGDLRVQAPLTCSSCRRSRWYSNSCATFACRMGSNWRTGRGWRPRRRRRSAARGRRGRRTSAPVRRGSADAARWPASGTSSTNSRCTGLPSGASNCTGAARRRKAPTASFSPLMRPCGIATPWPSPVEPSFSRANRLSNTVLRPMPWLFSNSRPACSKTRFLLLASRPTWTLEGGQELGDQVHAEVAAALGPYRARGAYPGRS